MIQNFTEKSCNLCKTQTYTERFCTLVDHNVILSVEINGDGSEHKTCRDINTCQNKNRCRYLSQSKTK